MELFASFMVSLVGFAIFVYGRRQTRIPHLAGGILMMVFPYFVSDVLWVVGGACAIALLLWLVTRVTDL